MNSKEIIQKTIRREETSRVAVALLSGGVWTFNRRGYSLQDILGKPDLNAQIIAETYEEVKSDIVWVGSGFHNLAIKALGGKIKFRVRGAPDIQEPLLTSIEDIANIRLDRIKENKDIQSLWQAADILTQKIGSQVLVGSSQWGPFTLAGHLYGIEKLMRNIYKDRQTVFAVLDFTTKLCYQYLEPFITAGVEIISIADPSASGDLISRDQFREFVLPYLQKIVAKLHQRGVFVSIHICGNITNRLDLIPESGTDVLSVDYKVDLSTVKEVLGGKIAFAGNMNPVGIMQNATASEVAETCRECIERTKGVPGYILMPGCDIPPGVPLANIQAMIETVGNS